MRTIVAIFCTLFATVAVAQQNDPAAKAVLDKVSAKFKTLKTVQAKYSLNVTNRMNQPAGKRTGNIFLKGQKYLITEKSMQIMSDGKQIWKYEPAANEVSVSPVEANAQGITPQKLFTNFYDKDFLYKLNGKKNVAGKNCSEIEMTPTDKRKNFYKVYVYVDEAQALIVSSKVYENSGNVYEYTLSGFKANAPLDDKMFAFDKAKYPGVEVIEQ